MSGARATRCAWAMEALKALRGYWLTVDEFAEQVGIANRDEARRDLREMAAQGFVLERVRSRDRHPGHGTLPVEYTLHPQWIGEARP